MLLLLLLLLLGNQGLSKLGIGEQGIQNFLRNTPSHGPTLLGSIGCAHLLLLQKKLLLLELELVLLIRIRGKVLSIPQLPPSARSCTSLAPSTRKHQL